MSELLFSLRQAGLSELACQFAKFIQRLDKTGDDVIAQSAALLSEAVSQGHVCLNLAQVSDHALTDLPEHLSDWISRLKQSNVVGQPDDYVPLILTDEGLLYLYRHWQDEQDVAKAIRQRCQPISITKQQQMQQDFADWTNDIEGIDWQKVSVYMALTRQFSVISGGPGTGKTTIVLHLLKMLFKQDSTMKIALAAPTGKAAARLQQAINNSGYESVEAKTLHRLLAITVANQQGRYNAEHPLAIDMVIIDEASMIDISLMATLMKALPDKARVVLLGDSQQLSSVESGAVLANLCQQSVSFSTEFCQDLAAITGINITASQGNTVLSDSVVELQHSYRFDTQSDIGQLASAVQSADIQAVFNVTSTAQTSLWQQQCDPASLLMRTIEIYQPFLDAITNSDDALSCLQLFERQRVLCALKNGPQSVNSINQLIERYMQKQAWRTHQTFYHGRPIMVTQNDHRQQLFNGDTGVVLQDKTGQLRACFMFDNTLHWFDLARLPAHETAFAMTIHKSQGSEFDNVCIVLAEEESPLLTTELLYTAITRAKKHVILLCSESILTKTVTTHHQRETGLAGLLK